MQSEAGCCGLHWFLRVPAFAPDLMRRINTHIVNIAAGRTGGLSFRVKGGSLRYTVGATTAYNLHVRHYAEFLDACLRASDITVNTRLRCGLGVNYGATSCETADKRIQIP